MSAEKCVEEHLNRSPGLRQALNLLSRALYGAEFHALLVHDARKARRVVKKFYGDEAAEHFVELLVKLCLGAELRSQPPRGAHAPTS